VKSLKWNQVNDWRLSQHSLSQRLKRQDFVQAVTQTGGIQAQVMSAAELALWARTDGLLVQHVKSALWQDHTLVKTYKSLVFRPQGWISAVVLVNGCIKGVWEYKTHRAQTTVKVRMFSPPTTALKQSIEAELERLGAFFNTKVVLEFEHF